MDWPPPRGARSATTDRRWDIVARSATVDLVPEVRCPRRKLRDFRGVDVLAFVGSLSRSCGSAGSRVAAVSHMRGLLRYLHGEGIVRRDLAGIVPRVPRGSTQDFRAISHGRRLAVVDAIDASTSTGKRDALCSSFSLRRVCAARRYADSSSGILTGMPRSCISAGRRFADSGSSPGRGNGTRTCRLFVARSPIVFIAECVPSTCRARWTAAQ